jgi:hypothetical protein
VGSGLLPLLQIPSFFLSFLPSFVSVSSKKEKEEELERERKN